MRGLLVHLSLTGRINFQTRAVRGMVDSSCLTSGPIQLAWMVNKLVRLTGIAPRNQGPIRLVRMVNQFHHYSGENFFTN
jgi:hypothetical protein